MNFNKGFTLLEILLVMAIILLVSIGSLVGFRRFSANQNLNIARDTLLNTLNEAKAKALSQVVATAACNQTGRALVGYQVSFDFSTDPDRYFLQEVCSGVTNFPIVKTISLPTGVNFESPPTPSSSSPIRFYILSGEANNNAVIRITSGSSYRSIGVDTSGIITENE